MPLERVVAAAGDPARCVQTELARLGIRCGVDVRDAVALVIPADDDSADRFAAEDVRCKVLEIGRAHGFARVALVVGDC